MNLLRIPSVTSNISDIADFLEAKCILSSEKSFSINSARSIMSIESDELNVDGIIDDDYRLMNRLEDALSEISQRGRRCNDKYPFSIEHNRIIIKDHIPSLHYDIYAYLLFATIWNMGRYRIMGGIDGALLFEELSEKIAKSYFGENTESQIFGTGSLEKATFQHKIEVLLSALNEGGCFKEPEGSTGRQNDGKLDIIVWKPFSDRRGSKLIGMGQCKTGSSWEDTVTQLQPSAFFGSYCSMTPYVDPVRMFFVAASCKEKWEELSRMGGIFFDRSRIMDYLPDSLDDSLLNRINTWLSEIIHACIHELE